MENVLIIDHKSSIVNELIDGLISRGYDSLKLVNYLDLGGIKAEDYNIIFSVGGDSDISHNGDLEEELRVLGECVKDNIPTMSICHGAQICAYFSGGEYSKLENPIKGVFSNYIVKKEDPIITGIQEQGLSVLEWHEYKIDSVGDDWDVIMTNNEGIIEIARHKTSRVYIVQFHPEAIRPKTNAGFIFNNFLKAIIS